MVAQVGKRCGPSVLIHECEVGDRVEHGQRALTGAMQFHQRQRIRHAQHNEEQEDANPERSRQLLRSISHKVFD
jgi:hypothetical protein